MDAAYKSFPFELKDVRAEGSDELTFSGYASAFGNIDRGGDVVVAGAFRDTIPDFLQKGFVAWNHDWDWPIGKPVSASEDANGLFVSAKVFATTQGTDAMKLLREGVVQYMSIGYRATSTEHIEGEAVTEYLDNGKNDHLTDTERAKWMMWGIRVIKALELFEFSPASVPMNPNTPITNVKELLAGRPDRRAVALALSDLKDGLIIIGDDSPHAEGALIGEAVEHLSAALEILSPLADGAGSGIPIAGSPPTATAALRADQLALERVHRALAEQRN